MLSENECIESEIASEDDELEFDETTADEFIEDNCETVRTDITFNV